jgi:hypothetical protein
MDVTGDNLFQIVLFLAGALIGVVTALNRDNKINKILGVILTIALIGTATVWYVLGWANLGDANCPYSGNTDQATFQNLIRAEEKAALAEDTSLLDQVYLPGATITDVSTGTVTPMLPYYQTTFANVDFIELQHYDIKIIQIDTSNAWVISTDSGTFFSNDAGRRFEYVNEPGSNHYIFSRDASGCWKISHFSVQAQNEPFP